MWKHLIILDHISQACNICSIMFCYLFIFSFCFDAFCNLQPCNWQPELSALLDTLEQSACNPEVVIALSKSLLHILQISSERTVASFKTLNGVPRLLKVACVQAQEHRRYENVISSEINYVGDIQSQTNQGHDSRETGQSYLSCLETIMEVFTEFFSIGDEAKNLVMLSSTSIDCLFDLFWEETLRSHVLKHTLELMKVV